MKKNYSSRIFNILCKRVYKLSKKQKLGWTWNDCQRWTSAYLFKQYKGKPISKIKVTGYKAVSIASNEGGSAIRCWINGVTGLSVTSCVFNDCDAPVSGGGGAIHIKNYSAAATFSL